MGTKLMVVELSSIAAEGERFRTRFTDPKNRQNIVDVLSDEAPDLRIGKRYVLTVEVETPPASG